MSALNCNPSLGNLFRDLFSSLISTRGFRSGVATLGFRSSVSTWRFFKSSVTPGYLLNFLRTVSAVRSAPPGIEIIRLRWNELPAVRCYRVPGRYGVCRGIA